MEKSKLNLLTQKPSPSNCLKIRSAALQCSAPRVAAECDNYMAASLNSMLQEEDFLSLPRIQVNVDLSDRPKVPGSESVMIPVEDVASCVVKHLQQLHTESFLEEKAIEVSYTQHLSLYDDKKSDKSLSPTSLSPEKLYLAKLDPKGHHLPSPARKLILPESTQEEEDEEEVFKEGSPWKIIGLHRMSEIGAICVIDRSSSLVVLNITLMLSKVTDKPFPVSPTTGLPYTSSGNSMISQMCAARSGFAAVPVDGGLISMGGFNREGILTDIEQFNFHKNQWEVIGKMTVKRARFGVTQNSSNGVVYAIGGSDGRLELGSTEVYNPGSNTWKTLESRMITPRSCFGAACLKGRVYVAGGSYYSIPLKSAEMFDPQTNRWRSLPQMSTTRNGLSVVSCGGKVYAIGGQSSGWRCLKTVECYDPVKKSWSNVANMKRPRRNATALTIQNKIYVFGGYDGTTALNQVEVYDPSKNEWSDMVSMATKRSGACAVHVDNTIFVTGGFSGSVFLNSVERFDICTQQWSSYV